MFPKKFTPGIDCMFVCQKISLKWWPNYSKFDEDPVFWEVDFVFFTLLFRAVNTPGKFSNFEKLTLSITAKPNMTRIWYRRFKIHFKAKRQIMPLSCACNPCCGVWKGIRDSLHISRYVHISIYKKYHHKMNMHKCTKKGPRREIRVLMLARWTIFFS